MDELRLIILGAGAVVIALIYLWGMRKRIKASIEERRRRRANARLLENEPRLEPATEISDTVKHPQSIDEVVRKAQMDDPPETASGQVGGQAGEQPGEQPGGQTDESLDSLPKGRREYVEPEIAEQPQMTVLLTVMPPMHKRFGGIRILEAAQTANLRLNRNGTLDYLAETAIGPRCIFRVGHLKEPGVFDLDTVEGLETSGLLLFMELPGPVDALPAVDLQLKIAAQLAVQLGGSVCDERRNKMTTQAMIHLRSEAAEFERRLRVWAQQPRD